MRIIIICVNLLHGTYVMTLQKPLKLALLVSTISIFSALTACGSDDNSEPSATQANVKNTIVDVAHAMYSNSLETAKDLQDAVDALIETPTEPNLQAAKDAYKATRAPYQQSEIMRFDTPLTENSNLDSDGGPASVDDWEGQINAWPLDEGLIDYIEADTVAGDYNAIASALTLTTENIVNLNELNDNEANVATGVHAIEFLLWGQDLNGTAAGAGERSYTDYDTQNCTNGNCDRRASYLKIVTDLLVSDLEEMTSEWTEDAKVTQGTLAYNFVNNDESISSVVGAMVSMATDELASARMGAALDANDTEEEHDCFSDLSHIAIYNNFQGVKNAFYGSYGSVSGPSIADLIKEKDQATFDAFDASLASIEIKMKQLLDAGERSTNTVRFDQIIGQDTGTGERAIAEAAVLELINLDSQFSTISEILSLSDIALGGGGDGD